MRKTLLLLVVCLVSGCTGAVPKPAPEKDDDAQVRKTFAALQTALKARDGMAIYMLLDSDSRQDADRRAKAIREIAAKTDQDKKQTLAKKLGLPVDKLADLKGDTFLESNRFFHFHEHDEIPDVKALDKVLVKGATAKVEFKDPDKPENTTTLKLVRDDLGWRLQLEMPPLPE